MVSVVTLIAEGLPWGDDQVSWSVMISGNLRGWQYKDTLDEIGDEVWDGLADEWAVHIYEEEDGPAF